MATTIAYRAGGPTYALSVTNTAHGAVAIGAFTNDQLNYVALLNTGSTVLAVDIDQVADSDVNIPADGASGGYWILPALMTQPMVVSVPAFSLGSPLQINAIGSAAGPSLLYVTPLVNI